MLRPVATCLALILTLLARPAAADDPPLREALRAATSITLTRRPAPSPDGRADLPVHVVALTTPADVAPVVSALTESWVEPAHVPSGGAYELEVQRDGALIARGRLVLSSADDGGDGAFLVIDEPARHTVAISSRVAWLLVSALEGKGSPGSPCPRCRAWAFVVSLAVGERTPEDDRRVRRGELLPVTGVAIAAGLGCKACGEVWPLKRPVGR